MSLAAILSDIVPADPPVFGRIVAFHLVDDTCVIVTPEGPATRPGTALPGRDRADRRP